MSQITRHVDPGYTFVHNRHQQSPRHNSLQYNNFSNLKNNEKNSNSNISFAPVTWSTPNLNLQEKNLFFQPQPQQQQQLIPPGHYVPNLVQLQQQQQQRSNSSMVLPSKLPQKKGDPSSRIPGPGSNLRVNSSQGNSVRSKINSSSSNNGHSGQSSLLMAGRDTARRSASPQVTARTPATSSITNFSSSSSSSSPCPSLGALRTGTNNNNGNINNSSPVYGTPSDIRVRKASTDRNNAAAKIAIRPPRPTSIPASEGKLSSSSTGQVSAGRNAINKYLTGQRVPKIPSSTPSSVTHSNGKQPLKEFMANRRIVEATTNITPASSTSVASSDHSSTKIATIAPSTKVSTSAPTIRDPLAQQGRPFPSISPSSLSELSINSTNSTNSVLSTCNHKVKEEKEKQRPSPPLPQAQAQRQATPPPITPRKINVARNNGSKVNESISFATTNSLPHQINGDDDDGGSLFPFRGSSLTVEVTSPSENCHRKDSRGDVNVNSTNASLNTKKASPASSISNNESLKSPCSSSSFSLSCSSSPSSLSPTTTHTSLVANGKGYSKKSVTNSSLSTFTVTSTVTSTSPPPPLEEEGKLKVIPSDESSTLPLPSPISREEGRMSETAIATVTSQSWAKEDKEKSNNGTSGEFDRMNALTRKSGELREGGDQVPIGHWNNGLGTGNGTSASAIQGDPLAQRVANVNGNGGTKSLQPSIHVYPFIREETGPSLGQLSMSSLLHSMSSRRLDKITNGQNNNEYPSLSATLARSSFNLASNGYTVSGSSPVSFSSSNNPVDIGMRPCDLDFGVRFPREGPVPSMSPSMSMRNLIVVTPPPTPFGPPVINGTSSHLRRLSKNSDLRGSAASLLSGSSNFSSVSKLLSTFILHPLSFFLSLKLHPHPHSNGVQEFLFSFFPPSRHPLLFLFSWFNFNFRLSVTHLTYFLM